MTHEYDTYTSICPVSEAGDGFRKYRRGTRGSAHAAARCPRRRRPGRHAPSGPPRSQSLDVLTALAPQRRKRHLIHHLGTRTPKPHQQPLGVSPGRVGSSQQRALPTPTLSPLTTLCGGGTVRTCSGSVQSVTKWSCWLERGGGATRHEGWKYLIALIVAPAADQAAGAPAKAKQAAPFPSGTIATAASAVVSVAVLFSARLVSSILCSCGMAGYNPQYP